MVSASSQKTRKHAGRAPPIDYLTGESSETILDDWVPLFGNLEWRRRNYYNWQGTSGEEPDKNGHC